MILFIILLVKNDYYLISCLDVEENCLTSYKKLMFLSYFEELKRIIKSILFDSLYVFFFSLFLFFFLVS